MKVKALLLLVLVVLVVSLSCNKKATGPDEEEEVELPPRGTIVELHPLQEDYSKLDIVWAEDGKSVFFTRDYDINTYMHTLQIDLATQEELSDSRYDEAFGCWIDEIFVDVVNDVAYLEMHFYDWSSYRLSKYELYKNTQGNLGEEIACIFEDEYTRRGMALSPDGSTLGYFSRREDNDLYFATLDLSTYEESVWFEVPYGVQQFCWDPSGTSVIVNYLYGSDADILRVPISTSWQENDVLYHIEDAALFYPAISDDGNRLAFVKRSFNPWGDTMYELNLTTQEIKEVLPFTENYYTSLVYSPNGGDWIAYCETYTQQGAAETVNAICWPAE